MSFIIVMILAGLVGGLIGTLRRRGPSSDKELTEVRERMLRLEQSVETMTADMERFADGQRFLTALLEERAREHPAIKPPSSPPPSA